jgi:hypothetical protein
MSTSNLLISKYFYLIIGSLELRFTALTFLVTFNYN